MKRASLLIAVLLTLAASTFAAEEFKGKKATLTGDLKCAKCALKEGDKCQTVLQMNLGDADKHSIVTYYLEDNEVAKGFHPKVCHETKRAKVTGVIGKRISNEKYPFIATKIEEVK